MAVSRERILVILGLCALALALVVDGIFAPFVLACVLLYVQGLPPPPG